MRFNRAYARPGDEEASQERILLEMEKHTNQSGFEWWGGFGQRGQHQGFKFGFLLGDAEMDIKWFGTGHDTYRAAADELCKPEVAQAIVEELARIALLESMANL